MSNFSKHIQSVETRIDSVQEKVCAMLRLGFFLSITFCFAQSAILSQCYQSQADFANACITILNGTVDGGRCFFFGGRNKKWATGWDACAQYGAQVAQIHTEGEFLKVVNYLAVTLGPALPGYVMVALYDTVSPMPTNTCIINLQNTLWYDNATGYNPKLTAGNTWVRYHQCDGDAYHPSNPPVIFVIYSPTAGTYWFGDSSDDFSVPGSNVFNVLCQYNNQAQTFHKTLYCLTENPIATASASNPNDCAQECANQGWCRGYNYVFKGSSFVCELFTWSVYDTCPKCASKVWANLTCTYFNYNP